MRTLDLDSWDDFPQALADLRAEIGIDHALGPERQYGTEKTTLLFRGHTRSQWGLETTLERWSHRPFTVEEYLRRAHSCVNEIESVTGRQWNLMSIDEIEQEIASQQTATSVHLPHYDYLIYLRHHGFPSPLLDWTTSPYVAAYFAFEQQSSAERCGVYVLLQRPQEETPVGAGGRLIQTQGPKVTAHVRHFSQKAWYTTSTVWDEQHGTHTFIPHVDQENPQENERFLLITLPRHDRARVLRHLEDYNINHFTLYQTDDALIRTMTLRTFVLAEE